jgi:hypothetical protein
VQQRRESRAGANAGFGFAVDDLAVAVYVDLVFGGHGFRGHGFVISLSLVDGAHATAWLQVGPALSDYLAK